MRERGTSHLAATVEMSCGFCGATESLPGDDQQKVLALRSLLVQRRWAEDAACGPALAYLKMLESGRMIMLPYAFGAFLVVATLLRDGRTSPYAALPIGVIGGASLATFLAYRIARTRLRRTLGPLIRSFPGSPGRPQRCRRCGAELPAAPGAFVECRYCKAANLASHEILAEHAAIAREQTADALLYARGTAAQVTAAGTFVGRAFKLAFITGAAVGAILAFVVFNLVLT